MNINKEFEKKWIESFVAENLNHESVKRKRYFVLSEILREFMIGGLYENYERTSYGFLWNAMAFNIINHMKDADANAEFDNVDKEGAKEFFYDSETKVGLIAKPSKLNRNHQTAKQIIDEDLSEFYVIGKDWKWCYVRNHEEETYFVYSKKD